MRLLYDLILAQVRWGQFQLLLAVSNCFLSWWEEVFVLPVLVGGLWLHNLVGAIMFLWGLWLFFILLGIVWGLCPFVLGGDYDSLFLGAIMTFLFLGIMILCFWGRLWFFCGDFVGIMSSSHLYLSLSPLKLSMGGWPHLLCLFLLPAIPGDCELGPGCGWQVKREREDQGILIELGKLWGVIG